MSFFFKSQSRDNRNIAFGSITNVPAPGRQKPKAVESQAFQRQVNIKKSLGRSDINDKFFTRTFNNTEPNEHIEKTWYNQNMLKLMTEPRKAIHSDDDEQKKKKKADPVDVGNLEQKYKLLDSIETVKKQPLPKKPLLYKRGERDQPKVKTQNISSHGYHQWDPNTRPNSNDIYWPPVPKKTFMNHTVSLDFKKQSNRIKIYDMTKSVNESRFEYIEKSPQVLSTQVSPRMFTISTVNRVCKLKKTQ